MTKQDITVLAKENAFDLIGKEWMLVTAGTPDKYNTMTFIRPERFTHEFIEGNDRLTLSFYDEEYRKALQICGSKSGRDINKTEATGLTPETLESGAVTFGEAKMTLDCRKLFKSSMKAENFVEKSLFERFYNDKPGGGLHDIYIVEIENIYTK